MHTSSELFLHVRFVLGALESPSNIPLPAIRHFSNRHAQDIALSTSQFDVAVSVVLKCELDPLRQEFILRRRLAYSMSTHGRYWERT